MDRFFKNKTTRFAGVFPSDSIPKQTKGFPLCFVANTAPSNEAGEHWVACWANSLTDVEFFDSAGFHESVYVDLRLPYKIRTRNTLALQSNTSSTCGHFCTYYLCLRAFGVSFHSIVSTLRRKGPSASDKLVLLHLAKLTTRLSLTRPCTSDCKGSQCCRPVTSFTIRYLLQ